MCGFSIAGLATTDGATRVAFPGTIRIVAIVAVLCACTISDAPSRQGQLLDAGLEDPQMISIGHSDYVRGFPFLPGEQTLASSAPLLLDGEYVLEFLPTAEKSSGSIQLRVVAGSEDLLVREFEVTPPREYENDFARRSKVLANPHRIDLSAFRGRSVRMVWTYRGSPLRNAALAHVRLRRKDRGNHERPDILLVCSDTHRADYATGEKGRRLMPRLDRLASDSVVYQRAYSPASWTLPSIASTMTGLLPRRHLTGRRIEGKFAAKTPPTGHLVFRDQLMSTYPAEIETLAEKLRLHGYTTVLVSGNWFHFGSGLFADGHDFALGGKRWRSMVLADDAEAARHPSPGDYRGDGESLNRKALTLLSELPAEDPLLMIVHYMDVHDWSFHLKAKSKVSQQAPSKAAGTQVYEEQVRSADRYLGELLDVWSRQRGYEQSMIVFFSDHGEHLYDPGESLYHGHTMADALLHVPLVVKYPRSLGLEPHASRRNVSLVDLVPTIVELTGVAPSGGDFDGISLLDLSQDGEPRTLFADYQLYDDERSSVQRGPMKLVINLSRGTDHLVDLRKPYTAEAGERGQTVVNPRVRESLRDAFRAYARESRERTRGIGSHHSVDPDEATAQLRSLGYLE